METFDTTEENMALPKKRKPIFIVLAAVLVLAAVGAALLLGGRQPKDYIGSVAADNTITLRGVEKAGMYTLRYANAKGDLSGYADICTLEVTTPARAVSYDALIPENSAPAGATMIAVYNESGERVGVIDLGSLAVDYGKKLYSFGAISDVHIGFETAKDDFKNALRYLSDTEQVSFIGIAGDLTSNAIDTQYTTYKNIVSNYASVPVYAITGNHDTETYRGSNVSGIISNYTGQPLYYSFEYNGDVYIMLGVEAEKGGAHLATGELQWLYETLEKNRSSRCFIFTHVYLNNSSGDPGNIYGFDLWSGTEEEVLLSLLDHYPNVTIFHGHSHVEFALQALDESTNVHTASGYNSVHIPSITAPRTGTLEGGSIRSNYVHEKSEGYVVDVYEDGIVLRGRDFVGEAFLPIAHYYIPTPVRTVDAETYTDDTGTIDPAATFTNFSITYDLPHATAGNAAQTVREGFSFATSIVPEWGYVADEIRVTMGGTDITDSVVTDSSIYISSVTGDVVISASTYYTTINVADIVGYRNDTRMSQQTGELKEQAGYAATDGYIALEPNAVYQIRGLDLSTNKDYCMLSVYDQTFSLWTSATFGPERTYPFVFPTDDAPMLTIDRNELGDLVITVAEDLFTNSDFNRGRNFRICGYGFGEDLFITKNQDLPEMDAKPEDEDPDNLIDAVAFRDNTRISQSTGELKEQEGYAATEGYVKLEPGAVYRISGLDFGHNSDYCMMMLYNESFVQWTAVTFGPDVSYPFNSPTDSSPVLRIDCGQDGTLIVTVAEDLLNNASMNQGRYFRICGFGSGENLNISKN